MKKILIITLFLAFGIGLASCGGSPANLSEQDLPPTEEEIPPDQSEIQENTSGAEFQEADLPADFPESFPLPENTKVASTTPLPGDQSYRVFFAFPELSLEDVLVFYNQELDAAGWSVDAEGPDAFGYGIWATHPEYEAELLLIEDEFGVVLDLTIAPLGELEDIPDSDAATGDSESLGEAGGAGLAEFPVPSKFTAIDLPAKLADEGYQFAFSYPDMPELAIIEFSTALMGSNWAIGDFQADAMGSYYLLPFTGPDGFQGYVLISSNPDVVGLPAVSGAVIALHAGTP